MLIQRTARYKGMREKVNAVFAETLFSACGGQPRRSGRRCTEQQTQIPEFRFSGGGFPGCLRRAENRSAKHAAQLLADRSESLAPDVELGHARFMADGTDEIGRAHV